MKSRFALSLQVGSGNALGARVACSQRMIDNASAMKACQHLFVETATPSMHNSQMRQLGRQDGPRARRNQLLETTK